MKENYRVTNARITNSKKFPNGYLYILKLKGFDLFKIGVSNNPKRRIRDIKSCLPFESSVVFCKLFDEVYSLEKQIHDIHSINKVRKEWYNISDDDLKQMINILTDIHYSEVNTVN